MITSGIFKGQLSFSTVGFVAVSRKENGFGVRGRDWAGWVIGDEF